MLIRTMLDRTANIKRDGAAYLLPEELDGTAFVAIGNEVLQVPRLERVEIVDNELCLLRTQKGEQFFFPVSQVVGFRCNMKPKSSERPSAGFR